MRKIKDIIKLQNERISFIIVNWECDSDHDEKKIRISVIHHADGNMRWLWKRDCP